MKTQNPKSRVRPWLVRRTELVLSNQWAKVRRDECELANGEIVTDYFYWEGNDFAQIFALTPGGQVVLTRQYKHGVKEVVIELPGGQITGNETAESAAERELREETGYVGKEWKRLGRLNVSSAKATTRATAFLLIGAERQHRPELDRTEEIEVFLLPIDELLNYVSAGEIRDVNSVATTLLALRELGRV